MVCLCRSPGQRDFEAESLDPALEPLRLNRGIVAQFEEARAGVVVEGTVGEQVPGDVDQQPRARLGALSSPLVLRRCERSGQDPDVLKLLPEISGRAEQDGLNP